MANTATAKSLLADVASTCDESFTDRTAVLKTSVLKWLNAGLAELHDLLARKFEDYAVSTSNVSLVAGTEAYSLPTDFKQALALFVVEDSRRYELRRFAIRELALLSNPIRTLQNRDLMYRVIGSQVYFAPEPTAAGTVELWYVPQVTELELGQAEADIGSGTNGTVTVTHDGGVEGNLWTVEVVAGSGNNVALSAAISDRALTVTLGTDGVGALDATKNTAALVAGVINGLGDVVSAAASGTGASALTGAEGPNALSGGDDGDATAISVEVVTGWEALLVAHASARVRIALEEDPAPMWQEKAAALERINRAAKDRDAGQAIRVLDARNQLARYDPDAIEEW